ncbi:hypothetical protein L1887_48627 [Cichorium endivia]|nr:hypothetical protein L1887_48627 [Cichorium endivia]
MGAAIQLTLAQPRLCLAAVRLVVVSPCKSANDTGCRSDKPRLLSQSCPSACEKRPGWVEVTSLALEPQTQLWSESSRRTSCVDSTSWLRPTCAWPTCRPAAGSLKALQLRPPVVAVLCARTVHVVAFVLGDRPGCARSRRAAWRRRRHPGTPRRLLSRNDVHKAT